MNEMTMTKTGPTLERYKRAMLDKAFAIICDLPILETRAEHFLKVLRLGTVATNVYLRRLHNFALDMNWLPWPILPKKQWTKVQFKDKRAITSEEHQAIITREKNPERKAFYELCWRLGGSQSDIAYLKAEDIDWRDRTLAYQRKKSKTPALIYLGDGVLKILQTLPKRGPLFPYLIRVRPGDRATEFKQRCQGLDIKGVTLHSYRYAWAERAKSAGYPERFAMENLGHNSRAVSQAYSKKAKVLLPSLEEWQKREKIIPLRLSEHERNDAGAIQAAI
jgi:integrase